MTPAIDGQEDRRKRLLSKEWRRGQELLSTVLDIFFSEYYFAGNVVRTTLYFWQFKSYQITYLLVYKSIERNGQKLKEITIRDVYWYITSLVLFFPSLFANRLVQI